MKEVHLIPRCTDLFKEPIRILSDLHFGYPASMLEAAEELLPLLRGVGTVIFNGDTVEMRFEEDREGAARGLEEIRALCRAEGAHPVFVNGNHDPTASATNHADLAGGAVLVTHGDMLFHDISPWNRDARAIGELHTRMLEEIEDDAFHDFEKRLDAAKRAALAPDLHRSRLPHGWFAEFAAYAQEFWPPWRPLQILKVWISTPARAVALARVFRPRARVIAIGHTHLGGIWRMGPRVVINTGSFIPGPGCRLIDLEGTRLVVRKIERTRRGFSPGKELGAFEAIKLKAHEGF